MPKPRSRPRTRARHPPAELACPVCGAVIDGVVREGGTSGPGEVTMVTLAANAEAWARHRCVASVLKAIDRGD
jgi:hypothetical protein